MPRVARASYPRMPTRTQPRSRLAPVRVERARPRLLPDISRKIPGPHGLRPEPVFLADEAPLGAGDTGRSSIRTMICDCRPFTGPAPRRQADPGQDVSQMARHCRPCAPSSRVTPAPMLSCSQQPVKAFNCLPRASGKQRGGKPPSRMLDPARRPRAKRHRSQNPGARRSSPGQETGQRPGMAGA